MSGTIVTLVGLLAMIIFIVIPMALIKAYFRSNRSSKIPTVLALLLWICVSVVVAAVWFIVAVAAHTVNESLTNSWIAANAVYPIIGIGIVLVHRLLLKRVAQ